MTSEPLKERWENPFISKLSKLNDIIFTCSRDNPTALKPAIQSRMSSYKQLIIELCSGSGGHLIELACRNPQALCIGIELRYKRLVRTAEKAKVRGCLNLNLLQVDAQVLSEVIEIQTCDKIYINFPDPWDGKSRWEDKYLLSKNYLSSLVPLLKQQGSFNYKTDHQRRFEQVRELIKAEKSGFEITEYSEDLHTSDFNCNNILSEFERLFTSQKKPVFYLKAIKSS